MEQLAELVGRSAAIEAVRSHVHRLAATVFKGARPPAVLIQGETGTGKGLVARLLHQISPRAQAPFVAINCAAIPEQLMESMLFGHERGAYTGADRARVGLLQSANHGVVFLDEIGLMPDALQAKLLVTIEDGYVRRVGSTQSERLDVWVVSASNVDLLPAIREGRFREDLYHRLARLTITLPPLRARGADVELLAEAFLTRACEEYALPPRVLTADARHRLGSHSWPGNVRELANAIERAALMADGSEITAAALSLREPEPALPVTRGGAVTSESALRDLHQAVLDETGGNISRTAERLEISRNTLRARIKRWNLRVAGRPAPGKATAASPEEPTPTPPASPDADAEASAFTDAREVPIAVAPPLAPELAPSAPAHIRWERRLITALAVSLTSGGNAEPFELAPLLHDLIAKVRSFGGWIEELTPSSLLVAFGAPAVEDAPARAAQAGRAILHAVERALELGVPSTTATLAIHARWCLTATGSDTRAIDAGDRRALRETLEALTELGWQDAILVSGDAAPLLQRRFVLDVAGDGEAAGHFRLMPGDRTGLQVGERSLIPLVGRDRELALLQELLGRAETGQGQVMGLVGEPGVGKSRLVYELREATRERVTWLEARCASYRSTTPYHPIVELVRSTFGVGDEDAADVVVDRVHSMLERLELTPADWAPYVLHLLGVKPGTEALAHLTPAALQSRTLGTLQQLALRGSRRRPIVFVVEDLHWIDQTSAEALSSLAESLHACAVLLLVTYRPGYQPPWLGRSYASQIAVQRLSREDSSAIISAVEPGLPDETAGAILDRGEGVPLFLEELARSVVEHARSRTDMRIPATVHGVIASRLDRLVADHREVLQVASVIGRDFTIPVLAAVSARDEGELTQALDRLQAAEFVHENPAGPARAYTFKHALTHEVTYESLLPGERLRSLHAKTAEAVERFYPDAPERMPEVLAHHYTLADRRAQAATFWLRAGQRAVRRSASAEAIVHLTKGLDLLATLPPSDERVRMELALQMALAVPLAITVGYGAPEVERVLSRARHLCQLTGDSPQLFAVLFGLWRFYVARAEFPVAVELANELLALAERRAQPALVMAAHVAAGVPCFYQGQLHRARNHFVQAVESYAIEYAPAQILAHGQDLGVGAWAFLGWTLGLLGHLEEAARAVDRSLELARAIGHPFSLALALHLAGMVRHLHGEHEEAARLGDEELELSRAHGFPFFLAGGLGLSGWARVCCGEHDAGLALMREGARTYRTTGAEVGIAHLAHLAEALVDAGCIAEALDVVKEGHARAARSGERAYVAEFHRVEGLARLRSDPADPEGAAECFRTAIDVARAQAARTLELRATVDLARLSVAQGAGDDARETLAEVYGWFATKEVDACRDLRAARELLSKHLDDA